MKKVKIFGCGPSGSILARRYAENGYDVSIFETRDHIAGNLYDFFDEDTGVIVHKYGPHIMHTSDREVIYFIKKYSKWFEFRHKVNVIIGNKEVPLPINFESIDKLFDDSDDLKKNLILLFNNKKKISILDLQNSIVPSLKGFANFIYEKVFMSYTTKMWGVSANEINQRVLERVPIRLSYDDGYFDDVFQAVPINGYTKFIKNILDHKNIKIFLNSKLDLLEIINNKTYINGELIKDRIIYTGPIDRLFNFKYGKVPYRSLKFDFEKIDKPKFQERTVTNYPLHPTMTRITDYGLLSGKYYNSKLDETIIGKEYPGQFNPNDKNFCEPYYPINNETNDSIINNYKNEVEKIPNLTIIGRLAEYKYKQMSHAIKDALNLEIK